MLELDITHTLKSAKNTFNLKVNISMAHGEILALYGESGAGKSSILRCIAGLLKIDNGIIKFQNTIFQDKDTFLPPQKRNIGFLFQDYGLFPHLNVWNNVIFADKKEIDFANYLMETMEISNLKNHRINEISGGQAQRVALARTLLRRPKLLLLDEPLSSLDVMLREKLQDLLLKLKNELDLSIILVSHSKSEVLKISDKVAYIKNGRCEETINTLEFFTPISPKAKVLKCQNQNGKYALTLLLNGEIYSIIHDKPCEIGEYINLGI